MKQYERLSLQEREVIALLRSRGMSIRSIGSELSRSPSTISREIQRNKTGVYYLPGTAHRKALKRYFRKARKLLVRRRLWRAVLKGLRQQWSPAQISARLHDTYPADEYMRVSAETIYTYLYVLPRGALRQELLGHLRQHLRARRPRSRGTDRRGQIPDMISIEERPAEVADRTIPGHWEGDMILGARHQSALGTLVERTTRTVLLVPIPLGDQSAESVRKAFARKMRTIPRQMRLSITYDRGKEMSQHRLFSKSTKMQVYFAHPQSPWERGTNENTNGLLRQYFPKGTDFNQVSARELRMVQDRLNGRPRKVLNWQTPFEVFRQLLR